MMIVKGAGPPSSSRADLLDPIIFRMAGLTDAEAKGLEERLAKML